MMHQDRCCDYQDCFEYHGSTTVEQTRKKNGSIIWRDWILFDSVEEAAAFFYETGWET